MARPADEKNWRPAFLKALSKSPNVAAAARRAKISRQHAYETRKVEPDFAADWDAALGESWDAAVGEMYRRAVRGTLKPVFHQGEHIGDVREYSDTLLIFALKSHRPETYNLPVRNEHTGADGKPIQAQVDVKLDLSKLSLDELLQMRQMVSKATDEDPDTQGN